jgi:hypothetical protein
MVRVNNTGTAVALWGEGTYPLWLSASVYQNGVWGTFFQLGNRGSFAPSLSVTPAGDAIVVYVQSSWDPAFPSSTYSPGQVIMSRRYDHITGAWTVAEQISTNTTLTYAWEPSVVTDSNGNAMAVWTEPTNQVFARRYDGVLGAWAATTTQLSSSPLGVYTPQIVVDGNNAFTAIWIEDTGTTVAGPNHPTPMVRRYVGGSWSATAQRIGWAPADFLYGNLGGANRLSADANAAGDISVVWEQQRTLANATTQFSVDTARFDAATGAWSLPSSIATNSIYLSFPKVAVDGSGNAMAVWTRTDPVTSGTSAQGSMFNKVAGTWSVPALIDQGSGTVSELAMGMDSSGNAEVVWADLTNGMTERRYAAATGTWSAFNKRTPTSYSLVYDMSDTGYGVLLGASVTIPYSLPYENVWAWVLTP